MANPQNQTINAATKQLLDKRLLETIPLAGMTCLAEALEVWRQQSVHTKYAPVERPVKGRASAQKKGG